jgi:hypothetical protein
MPDLIARLANRRCPACRTVQPLYVARIPNSRHAFLRAGKDVVPCPGCGLPLRLLDPAFDPHGIFAAIVLVTGFTAGVIAMIPLSARWGWSGTTFGLAMVLAVTGFALLGISWNILRTWGRALVRAEPAPPGQLTQTETPR